MPRDRGPDAPLDVSIFMPLLVNDYLTGAATFAMNNRQRGAFVQMLAHAWKQQASLPNDMNMLAKYADEAVTWLQGAEGSFVLSQFIVDATDGRRRNPKQTEVYADAVARRTAKHDSAVGAARARWERERAARGEGQGSLGLVKSEPTVAPIDQPDPPIFAETAAAFPLLIAFASDNAEHAAVLSRSMRRVFDGLGADSLAGFLGVVNAGLQGLDGPLVSAAEMATLLADWCDNKGRLEKNALRAYFRGAKSGTGQNTTNTRRPLRRASGNGESWKNL